MSSDRIDLTPNILASMITTTCLPPPLPPTASYKMTTERLITPDELNEQKKGVAGSGKDECYTTMSVQL